MEAREAAELTALSTPCALSACIKELTERWADDPDGSDERRHNSCGDARALIADAGRPQCLSVAAASDILGVSELYRAAKREVGDREQLTKLLDDIGLADIAESALRRETLRSVLVRLTERTDFLAFLKARGVSALPHRQKLANALNKVMRQQQPQQAQQQQGSPPKPQLSAVQPPPLSPLPSLQPPPLPSGPPAPLLPSVPPPRRPPPGHAAASATIRAHADRGSAAPAARRLPIVPLAAMDGHPGGALLVAADGRELFVCSRAEAAQHPPQRQAPTGLALHGPVLLAVGRLARLAAVHILVPLSPSHRPSHRAHASAAALAADGADGAATAGGSFAAAASDGSAAASAGAAAACATAAEAAHSVACELGLSAVAPLLPYRHSDAPAASAGCHWLPCFDELAAPPLANDERAMTRRRLGGRRRLAAWRGGRGLGSGAAANEEGSNEEGAALRARAVRHCAGRAGYDVGFTGIAAPMSRRQLGACRVLLLLDGAGGGWDVGWTWALGSGCVLVAVGEYLPPLAELEPWVHYVPAASDLGDLDERVRWALDDPAAELVARRCRDLHDELRASGRATRELARVFAELACEPP